MTACRPIWRISRRTRFPFTAEPCARSANVTLQLRALVLIVSDFLVPDGWQSELARLAQRHEVVAVRLHDPRESVLPDIGMAVFEDPETGDQLMVNTADAGMRERFRAAAAAQAERIRHGPGGPRG